MVGIARQYSHLSRSAEERFGIDDPFGPSNLAEPFDKVPPLSQGLQLAMKPEFSIAESSFQVCYEFGPEEAAEHLDRKKKLLATRNPTPLVERDSAAGNDALEVGMMIHVLSLGMQHPQKANASAEVSAIARDLHQRFGGAQQDAIDQPLALQNQRVLYAILFRAASETLLQIGADPKHLAPGSVFWQCSIPGDRTFSIIRTSIASFPGAESVPSVGLLVAVSSCFP